MNFSLTYEAVRVIIREISHGLDGCSVFLQLFFCPFMCRPSHAHCFYFGENKRFNHLPEARWTTFSCPYSSFLMINSGTCVLAYGSDIRSCYRSSECCWQVSGRIEAAKPDQQVPTVYIWDNKLLGFGEYELLIVIIVIIGCIVA
ncbi:hypothetical protein QVD17_05504 [Tagetes erecta]|uniref:Uncharacterized protein n=1 Tax=Tagetes erecta TaxID=13708 RepID=A0AAD8PB74_TARER|nr:hypothetical protein QVD17_05504 [Tagetes erecta]